MATKLKRVLCFLLVLALGLVPSFSHGTYVADAAQSSAEKEMETNEKGSWNDWKETHKKVAENDKFRLYVNEESLALVVEDKATGKYMESSPSYNDGRNNKTWTAYLNSALILTMIKGNDDTKQADLIRDDVTKKITYTEDGFEAKVYWNKYKFGMTLKVALTENGVTAHVPDDSIVEDGEEYMIGTVCIYPCMGLSYLDYNEGYMLIPDGNGALIYLTDKEGRFNTGFTSVVYGDDAGFSDTSSANLLWNRYQMITEANRIIAPVWGIAHTDDQMAYLAVIEEGAERASIEANPNGVTLDYNRAYAKFTLRKLYTQPTSNNTSSGSFHLVETDRSHSDLKIQFLFLTGEHANYAGMANAYREYLLANGTLSVLEDNEFRTRVDFLGTEREEFIIGTKAVVMTTVDDIYEIYEDLKEAGVTDILSVYKGWQKGGLWNIPITTYKADNKIGGTKKLTQLMQDAEEAGIAFYLYNEALRINPDEQNATFNTIKKINKKKYEEYTYKDVYEKMAYLTPARSNTLLNKFANSYLQQGVDRLCVAGITNTMFSYSYGGKFYSRFDCADSYKETLAALDEKLSLVLEQPSAYLWSDMEAFLDMPMYASDYIYEDESVPFLSLVLKGVVPVYSEYVNFEANKEEFFLKLIETGTYPSFYVTKESSADLIYTNSSDVYSSQYTVYKNEIVEYSKELAAVDEAVEGAVITGHEILANSVRVVTYSNGVKIYLNYSKNSQTVDGHSLEGMSYKVVSE